MNVIHMPCHHIFSRKYIYAVTSLYFIVYFFISICCYIYYTSSVVNIEIVMHSVFSCSRCIVSYVYVLNSVFRIFKSYLKCVVTNIGCPFLLKMDYKMRDKSMLMLQ
jgi:hypothetical protein